MEKTTEQKVLAAALDQFLDNGFEATRMEAVARRAGVAKGTVYLYASSKEDLFRAAVRQAIAPVEQALDQVIAETADDPASDGMHRFYRRMASFIETDLPGSLMRLVIGESDRFPELAETYYRAVVGPMAERMASFVAHRQKSGPADTDGRCPFSRYPQLLASPVLLAAIWRLLFQRVAPIDTKGMLDAFADVAVDSLAGRDDTS